MVYEAKSESFINFGEVVNDMRVVILGYVVKSCDVSFVFRNEKFPCDFFM